MVEAGRIQAKKIETKIAARKAARAMIGLIGLLDWPDGAGAQYADAFLDEMRKLLPMKKVDIPKPEPIARLGSNRIWYGGEQTMLDKIPMQFLHSKLAYIEKDRQAMKGYLNHPDIEARRGADDW